MRHIVVCIEHLLNLLRAKFSIKGLDAIYFMSGRFNGSCFIGENMACISRNYTFMRSQKSRNDDQIRLRSSRYKMDFCLCTT